MSSKYDFSQVGKGFVFCFLSDCPRCNECLRYCAGRELPDDRPFGPAVYPGAYCQGECRFFRKNEKVRLATGFGGGPMRHVFLALRRRMTEYLHGNGVYYQYRNGKKWLSPEQQEHIIEMCRRYGYTGEVTFDCYKDDYDFT